MKLLLDTNALLAILRDATPFSETTRQLLSLHARFAAVSIVSFWELAIKVSLGKLEMAHPPEMVLAALSELGAKILPIEVKHLRTLRYLPHHHRDPFDRMILAQALSDGYALVSSDRQLDAYGVARYW